MNITFLGTAAAEGFPAVFCNCGYCREARRLGGKNLRTRSQTLINDDLLIDLPADTYSHFLYNGICGDTIRNLLITHSHADHLYPQELEMRRGPFAHNMRVPVLEVYCGQGAYDAICTAIPQPKRFRVHLLRPYEKVTVGNYEVIPLPARHFEGDGALIYIIRGDKTILYAHDTGFFYDEVLNYIEKEQIRFDFVTLDCTNIDIPIADDGTHMGLDNIARLMKKLETIGAVDGRTMRYINHFSHNANPVHDLLEERTKDMNLHVAYDGRNVRIP
jgi:phosphoribosyl 1,2-cyclic phosphate phosphodiesterase